MSSFRAHQFVKIHHPDPSGFWSLVRTGEKLPVVGQQILFVYDIRGTEAELRRNLMRGISKGDPYKIANDAAAAGKRTDPMIAELFKLPVDEYQPSTHVGVVDFVQFDASTKGWIIGVDNKHARVWGHYDCECIVYWAPFPTAPNTYTPRPDDQDLWYYTEVVQHDRWIFDYLESRKLRNKKEEE